MSQYITMSELETTPRDEAITSLQAFLSSPSDYSGVQVNSDESVDEIIQHLDQIQVVVLDFPSFTDGRSYSSASILRQRGFQGEIRASGDIRIDQLEQMSRCGFNAFELNDDQNVELAKSRLSSFSYAYQASHEQTPLFRLRA